MSSPGCSSSLARERPHAQGRLSGAPVGSAKPPCAHARRRKSRAYANRDGLELEGRVASETPNNYRIDRVSGDPSVIARSPCDEAIQGPQYAGASNPDGRTAAPGLLRFARNDG